MCLASDAAMSQHTTIVALSLAVLLAIASGCGQSSERVYGTVLRVSIVSESKTITKGGGSPGTRAIVGAVVAGPIGAGIGAISVKEKSVVNVGKIISCSVVVKLDQGEEVIMNRGEYSNPGVYASLNPGDEIVLRKTTYKSDLHRVRYSWYP